MKDTLDPLLSAYSGVNWSACDDTTIEGEFPLAPLSLRYSKAQRRLTLRLTEISALEIWGAHSEGVAGVPELRLSGRGELAEVLTLFELDGGPVRQFQEVKKITIVPAPVQACVDPVRRQHHDPDCAGNASAHDVLFIDFEALRIHGEHPEPALHLNVTMGNAEFQRVHSLVRGRADEIREVKLVLYAELFGGECESDKSWSEWTTEYGMLRPAEAPLAYAPARLDRMDLVFERSGVLGDGAAAPASLVNASLQRVDQPEAGSALIARRLSWIIALLALIAIILLSGPNRTEGITRIPRQFAENAQLSTLVEGTDHVAAMNTSAQSIHFGLASFREGVDV